jgi:hypothetical protein
VLKRILVVVLLVGGSFLALFSCHYFLLWKPSLQGKCGGFKLGSSAPPLPHITRFRGQVVGKNLWIVQYRWLRRRFKAVGTTLSLIRDLPSTEYEGNVVRHGDKVGALVIDRFGSFDFGDLPPGEYELDVSMPGEDAAGFGFVIDPSARSTSVLIDASPAHYCNCCGWNFEPR